MKQGMPLFMLKKGQSGRVIGVSSLSDKGLRKSMSFGILPGTVIKVLQVFPVYVLQMEHTELAVDIQIVKSILVEKI
ncbi:MAG: ferrous iron transport protein A [Pelosinus sp.]|nr:ferrous iron transport protein A [Pelosinus sp.]